MATIHLVEGPVGAGKSTFAARLGLRLRAPHLNLDQWMVTLFRPDRPAADFMQWYAERKQRCIAQIWQVTCDLLDAGTSAILELGLVQRQDREAFYALVDMAGYELKVYVLDAPEEVRRRRVQDRNRTRGVTFQMEVPADIFELAARAWQPPDEIECKERNVEFVSAERPSD